MKTKNLMVGLIIIATFLMILPMNAAASAYSGPWEPNSDNYFAIELTPVSGAGSLYMYDYGNDSVNLFVVNDKIYSSNRIYFTFDSVNWWAGYSVGDKNINIGSTPAFGFYFRINESAKNLTYQIDTLIPNDAYLLTDNQSEPNTSMIVSVSGLHPIPIPATVWIFGAGLVALVGIRRKLKN